MTPGVSAGPGGRRIDGLDGLRGLSVALVLFGHLMRMRAFDPPQWLIALVSPFDLAELGVRVFFVISGFLITTLLLAEFERAGRISLWRFYFRRTLRIFPPFYLYIAAIAALAAVDRIVLMDGDLLHAMTYTVNYQRVRGWYLGHAWSLSVEEQFYLLWPVLFRILGTRRALPALVSFLTFAPVWRLVVGVWMPEHRAGVGETFFTTADSIAAGCLLALVRRRLGTSPTYRALMDSRWFYINPPSVLLANALGHRFAKLDWLITSTVQSLLVALAIERLTRDTGWMARTLAWRPLVLLGLLSYSLYLWQQPFLNPSNPLAWWTIFPENMLCALLLAATSYYYVERPALRLRERLETRWFPERPAPTSTPEPSFR